MGLVKKNYLNLRVVNKPKEEDILKNLNKIYRMKELTKSITGQFIRIRINIL